MQALLVLSLLALSSPQEPVHLAVPVEELVLAEGDVLPRYAGTPAWAWGQAFSRPWAVLDGPGEVVFRSSWGVERVGFASQPEAGLGELVLRIDAPREVTGRLHMPRSSGDGFIALGFRIPADRPPVEAASFERALLEHYEVMLADRVPGGAWFRHRRDELAEVLGVAATEPRARPVFRDRADTLELVTGGRALSENLQLERGLPVSGPGEETVALDEIEGVTVRAIDWGPFLGEGELATDPLAKLVPADQHALFFRSFAAFLAAMDESARLGALGLTVFDRRATDAGTRARYERQLCLDLSTVTRTFGPLSVEAVALTGSDPYLRTGSDVAVLLRCSAPEVVREWVAARQEASGAVRVSGDVAGTPYQGVVDVERRVSSYMAVLEQNVVVANSLVQLERVVRTAAGELPALAASEEYEFFRGRYPRGDVEETALLVLTDEAIRRWCSPRWRIGAARRTWAAAALGEEHAAHLDELVAADAVTSLGVDADFPDLGELSLSPNGVLSPVFGMLDFLTPVSELELERVTERERDLYVRWRRGYQNAWSNFFDPVGGRLSIIDDLLRIDLTVMPLIAETQYQDMRELTGALTLDRGEGDPHASALLHWVMAFDPDWEPLRSLGPTLGSAGQKLGGDALDWLAGWLAVYADEGDFWDEVLQVEDLDEVVGLDESLNEIPLAVVVGVSNPLKLALFMTALRAFAEGTAPGMTEWKERIVSIDTDPEHEDDELVERRFVEIASPGMGDELSLFYATTPTALILSLHEPTLLAAMAREEERRSDDDPLPQHWDDAHVGFEVGGRGVDLLRHFFVIEEGRQIRNACWANLPILNEWKRLYPDRDPVELHARVFRERLVCPAGGTYRWNDEWHTMESSVLGHPGAPGALPPAPRGWEDLEAGRFALTFENEGLRARLELDRR